MKLRSIVLGACLFGASLLIASGVGAHKFDHPIILTAVVMESKLKILASYEINSGKAAYRKRMSFDFNRDRKLSQFERARAEAALKNEAAKNIRVRINKAPVVMEIVDVKIIGLGSDVPMDGGISTSVMLESFEFEVKAGQNELSISCWTNDPKHHYVPLEMTFLKPVRYLSSDRGKYNKKQKKLSVERLAKKKPAIIMLSVNPE